MLQFWPFVLGRGSDSGGVSSGPLFGTLYIYVNMYYVNTERERERGR